MCMDRFQIPGFSFPFLVFSFQMKSIALVWFGVPGLIEQWFLQR